MLTKLLDHECQLIEEGKADFKIEPDNDQLIVKLSGRKVFEGDSYPACLKAIERFLNSTY